MGLYCHVNLYRYCYSFNIYFIYINWLYMLLKGIFISTIITKNQVFSFILYNVKKKRTQNFYFFFFLFFIFFALRFFGIRLAFVYVPQIYSCIYFSHILFFYPFFRQTIPYPCFLFLGFHNIRSLF